MQFRPYTIHVSDGDLDDLKSRLDHARWPKSLDDESWSDGSSLGFMTRLVDHWRGSFDWRAHEARLNRLSNYMAQIDDLDIHFVHQRGIGPNPMPLILTHGWPGSFVEMERIIQLLTDPASHGGNTEDAFDLVVPSLPGYGFSSPPRQPGIGSRETAMLWQKLMAGLGYKSFGAQGGDIGAGVSTWLARLFPEQVRGIHLNFIPGGLRPSFDSQSPPMTPAEQAFLDQNAAWSAQEGAYAALQSTKPQTLAFSLSHSPVGLAAWITEKFRSWSDCGGDIESIISMDELLTNISLYWFSQNLTSSLRIYKENRARPHVFELGERIIPPLGMALFPREISAPPRSWVERVFDVRQWNAMPKGGHFAALEQPELLAAEIRAFFRLLR